MKDSELHTDQAACEEKQEWAVRKRRSTSRLLQRGERDQRAIL